jgi:hypothetical protein
MKSNFTTTTSSSNGGANLSLWTPSQRSAPVAHRSSEDDINDRSMLSVGPSLITQSGKPTDEQFEDIRSRFGDPRANVTPDDYYAFRLIASGDGLDSYFTKQDLETSFPNFVRDLYKGQSVLGSHLMATFSYGSSFDGETIPADEKRAEYEPTFYPQWDTPELRTKNWLVGDYFITRGISVNNQNTDDLIRGIETGAIRKTSVSFMVGSYVCGIDGRDLVPTMFGPMPDEECNHFPGIAYEDGKGSKQIAWALMKNNTLVETSLVYKNASPSSMLLRKAEALASRGQLQARDIEKLESRFQIRLPRFQPTVYPVITTASSAPTATENVRFDAQVQEVEDMANRRRGGNDAARELVREALTAAPEPDDEVTPEVSEAPESADLISEAAPDPEPENETPEADASEAVAEAPVDGEAVDEAEVEAEAEAVEVIAEVEEAEAEADASEAVAELEVVEAAATPISEEDEAETTETTSESSREEEAVSAFVTAADRLASVIARNPDAFDTGLLAMAARSEKAIDLALIDAGCDTTVGSQVYRSFEVRSKKLTEALGEPLSVEAIRSLQSKAQLGDELFRELVKDAVAARVSAQGETFNAERYKEVLLGTRDVAYVKDEISSWKAAKGSTYTPGRSVVPRQPVDIKPTKDERKTLPEAPAAIAAKPKSDAPSMSLIQPRKKN